MDAAHLIREARVRRGITQRRLAVLAGTARSVVSEYETGAASPTVRTLNRILEACGLEAATVLQPIRDDTESRALALLDGERPGAGGSSHHLAAALDEAQVDWAFDGASAIGMHGLAAEVGFPAIVARDNKQLRSWLHNTGACGVDRYGYYYAPRWSEPESRACARAPICGRFGYLHLRFTDDPLDVIQVDDAGRRVPVLTLLAVELAHPDWAQVLARVRELSACRGSVVVGPFGAG